MQVRATGQRHLTPGNGVSKRTGAAKSSSIDGQAAEIHFSFEATLLFELINRHGDISQQLEPWYFPEAYLHNAEAALGVASKIVQQARQAGVQLDLNFVFNEMRQLNHIHYNRDYYQVFSAPLAQALEQLSAAEFVPGQWLAISDRQILKLLHQFAAQRAHPLAHVEDFALLYAMSKHQSQQKSDSSMQLNGNTAKFLVEHHLRLIEPDFVPLLIDFYKTYRDQISQCLTNSHGEHQN
ncbi:MAG: hypothetical protein OEW58_01320 [Gammaproteobacteria bacterium]|nr:hypothetical protein [Gammaproteobacteria bacterium]